MQAVYSPVITAIAHIECIGHGSNPSSSTCPRCIFSDNVAITLMPLLMPELQTARSLRRSKQTASFRPRASQLISPKYDRLERSGEDQSRPFACIDILSVNALPSHIRRCPEAELTSCLTRHLRVTSRRSTPASAQFKASIYIITILFFAPHSPYEFPVGGYGDVSNSHAEDGD
ncbi:uncharacterized protein LAESUDRAFT_428030 [Laetiporus sulphureus 93-53]|uniref:Uncharacterized protein n=1 Tax=Laetiporus sulphureus 93-53 TaxID=1314785 RepID=A0A165GLB4_9APHY|nr:uncharacterized protein LAESUDRAFT_428030 [Laetiporus sulphureus 93-53]KZT10508.1 hypothetical protein LAESUDRAFT_428030 [Laetiporus sulphureus 93-53]